MNRKMYAAKQRPNTTLMQKFWKGWNDVKIKMIIFPKDFWYDEIAIYIFQKVSILYVSAFRTVTVENYTSVSVYIIGFCMEKLVLLGSWTNSPMTDKKRLYL